MNRMAALRQYQKVNSHAQTAVATPHRLVQMLMEAGLDRIAQAKGAIGRKDIPAKGLLIGKAIEIIGGLREGLDMEKQAQALAHVRHLVVYLNKASAEANNKTEPKILEEVRGLLATVKEGWGGIGEQQ